MVRGVTKIGGGVRPFLVTYRVHGQKRGGGDHAYRQIFDRFSGEDGPPKYGLGAPRMGIMCRPLGKI